HLSCEEEGRPRANLPGVGQHGRAVHVRIAMHHAEADELSLLEPGNQTEDTCLIAPFDLRLESDEAEMVAREVVLTQLHGGVWLATRAWIDEADRFHRPEPQRVTAAMRHHFD